MSLSRLEEMRINGMSDFTYTVASGAIHDRLAARDSDYFWHSVGGLGSNPAHSLYFIHFKNEKRTFPVLKYAVGPYMNVWVCVRRCAL